MLARPSSPVRGLPAARPIPPRAEPSEVISVAYALQTLSEVRADSDIVVEEAPSARSVMQKYLPITRSEGFFTMDSGGLGYGMPAAVGVALAKPGARIIGIFGDGSSMYSIQSLWSAAQARLPMTFIILNNRRYAALQDFAPVFGFSDTDVVQGTELPAIDFVALATGMGCDAVRVSDAAALRGALLQALASSTPTLLEIEVA